MRFLAAFLAVILLATPACAWRKGYYNPTPNLTQGPGWSGLTAQPANQGDPGDYGYNDMAAARWDTVPYDTVTGAGYIGVVAYHQPTAAQYAAGVTSNIDHVEVSVDDGPWVSSSVQSVNPATGITGYVFTYAASDFTDAQHEARARVYPTTGVPTVLQGLGGGNTKSASMAGTVLTVATAGSVNPIQVNQSVIGPGVPSGTYIASFGTGTGGTGTYNLTGSGATLSSQNVYVGETSRLIVVTNAGNTLPHTIKYVNGDTGSDSNTGTSSSPYLTVSKARDQIYTAQTPNDVGGGVICIQAGSVSYANATENTDRTATRWLTVQPTTSSPCDGVSAGTVTLLTKTVAGSSISSAGMRVAFVHFKGLTITGTDFIHASSAVSSVNVSAWLEGVTFNGPGVTMSGSQALSTNFNGRAYCTETTIHDLQNGCINAAMARNVTLYNLSEDALSTSRAVLTATVYNQTNQLGSATAASGSPILTNFAGTANVQVGGYVSDSVGAVGKIPFGTSITAINADGANTLHLSNNATISGSITNLYTATSSISAGGTHPDAYQAQGLGVGNLIIDGLTANSGNTSQIFFGDATAQFFTFVVANSLLYNSDPLGQTMQIGNKTTNGFWLSNAWLGNMAWRTDIHFTATDFSIVNNTCQHSPGAVSGVTYRGGAC